MAEKNTGMPGLSKLCDGHFSLMNVSTEIFTILVLAHVFNLFLRPFGLSGPVSHVLAGMVLGPSGISRIDILKRTFLHDSGRIYNETLATFSRIIFMFLFGLQTDIPYVLRKYKIAAIVTLGIAGFCVILAAPFSPVLYHQTEAQGNGFKFGVIMILMLSSTSSPAVIKMTSELKLYTSEIGRLAIICAFAIDIWVLIGTSLVAIGPNGIFKSLGSTMSSGFICAVVLVAALILNTLVVKYLNQMNPHRKYLRNIEVFSILLVIMCVAMYTELQGFNNITTSFLLGVFFPREGKTYRTLVHKLDYPTHNFLLPIYFAYIGFQADFTKATSLTSVFLIIIPVILLSIVGKIGGTFATSRHLKISPRDSAILGLLLNAKGHVDISIITVAQADHKWSTQIVSLYIITVAINTVIVGPFLALIVNGERKAMAFKHFGLEWQNPDTELRILACVHGPRHVSTMIRVLGATTRTTPSTGSINSPFTIYLLHLVELTDKSSDDLLYHQQEYDEMEDDDYGGNDELEINEAVDTFFADTRVPVHQMKSVSPFTTMHEDLCATGRDLRVQIVLLPFHKHQRIDGKMENSKSGFRTTNQKVLRSAPCSIGILVDRGFNPIQVSEADNRHQIAVLFFGGPDDREALAYGSYMLMRADVKVTVFRFLPTTKKEQQPGINMESNEDNDVLMEIMSPESENNADEGCLTDFYNRYVTTRLLNYVEKYVENGGETMSVLNTMKDMYSLFVVGKGRGPSPLTIGMRDWEECPELGVVGDVLASSDFTVSGSVLVIQQHRSLKNEFMDGTGSMRT